MRARLSSRKHLSRDLTRVSILATCMIINEGILALPPIHIPWPFQVTRDSGAQPASIDSPYTGSIIVDTMRRNTCVERVLDNRTGAVWEIGTVSCDAVLARYSTGAAPKGISVARLQSLAKTFRHEND